MFANVLGELPLAVFTTLVPLSVGSFITVALAVYSGAFETWSIKSRRVSIFVPVLLLAAGFIAAFFHLTSPQNAVYVLLGVGRSPLASEVAVAMLYALVAAVYLIVELFGKGSRTLRKCLLTGVLAVGFLLVVFTGAAYYVETIAGWASLWPVVEQLGYMLMGTVIGFSALRACGEDGLVRIGSLVCIIAACGLAIATFANGAHLFQIANMTCYASSGAEFAARGIPYAIVSFVAGLTAVVCAIVAHVRRKGISLLVVSSVLVLIAVLLARFSFYCLQIGVGL